MAIFVNLAVSAFLVSSAGHAHADLPAALKTKIDAVVASKDKAAITKAMDETLKSNPQNYEQLVAYWQTKISSLSGKEPKAPEKPMPVDRLKEAIKAAIAANPQVKKSESDLAATKQNQNQAIAKFLPQVSADVEYGRQRNAQGADEFKYSKLDNKSVNLSQPIWHGGRNVSTYDKAMLQITNAELEYEKTKQRVSLDAAIAYVDLVSDWQLYQLSIANVDFLQKNLDITNDRFQLGEVSNTDLAQSKTRFALANASKLKAKNQYIASKAAFEKIVGSTDFKASELSDVISLPTDMPADLDTAINLAMANNIDIKQAENNFQISQEEVDITFADALPTVDLEASMRREEESGILAQEYDSDRLMLRLSVPLFKGGENVSRISQAKRLVTSREFELRDKKNEIIQEVKSLWEVYSTSTETIEASKIALDSAVISLDGVKAEEELGIRSVLDVLNAEEEKISAESNLIATKREQVRNAYQIMYRVSQPVVN